MYRGVSPHFHLIIVWKIEETEIVIGKAKMFTWIKVCICTVGYVSDSKSWVYIEESVTCYLVPSLQGILTYYVLFSSFIARNTSWFIVCESKIRNWHHVHSEHTLPIKYNPYSNQIPIIKIFLFYFRKEKKDFEVLSK